MDVKVILKIAFRDQKFGRCPPTFDPTFECLERAVKKVATLKKNTFECMYVCIVCILLRSLKRKLL